MTEETFYLPEELIKVLQKAMDIDKYHHPGIIQGIMNAIEEYCPNADKLITPQMNKWAINMWGQ